MEIKIRNRETPLAYVKGIEGKFELNKKFIAKGNIMEINLGNRNLLIKL